ncbi:DNA-binding protein [Vreelandella aquamarina]|uniref:DNA-binding protein n=1 Tax=Vreelandella aquamarina TaxID=77097 RepID=UPI0038505605
MARNGVQYSDVQQAIDELLTRGDTPSVQRIRDVLGTGSFTTISEHFRHWRLEREQNKDVPPPKGVPEVVVTAASELWRQAQEAAHQGLLHYREEADRKVADAHQAVELEKQKAAHAEQREKALTAHLRHIEEQLNQTTTALAQTQAHAQHWEAESQRHARAHDQAVEQLKNVRQQLQHSANRYQEEMHQQKQRLEGQLKQEQQRNETTEAKLMGLLDKTRQERTSEQKALNKKLHQQEEQIEKLQHSLKEEQHARQALASRLALTEGSLEEKSQRNEQLQHQQAQQHAQLESTRQELARCQQQYTEALKQQDNQWQKEIIDSVQALQRQVSTLPTRLNDDGKPHGAQISAAQKNTDEPSGS